MAIGINRLLMLPTLLFFKYQVEENVENALAKFYFYPRLMQNVEGGAVLCLQDTYY